MSSSNSPPNPGQTRTNPASHAPKPSSLSRYGPRILLIGTATGIAYALFASRAPRVPGTPNPPNPLRTPGVENIEGAYQSGGATSTHTPAYGGTTQGSKEDITRSGDGQFGTGKPKGFKEEGLGNEQRAAQGGVAGEVFNEMKYKDGKGK